MEVTEQTTNDNPGSGRALRRSFLEGWVFVVLPLGILSAILCRYWIDLTVARWCWTRHYKVFDIEYSKFVRESLVLMEIFGNDIGIVIVAVLIVELDRSRWVRLLRFFTAILLSGLAVNTIKLFVLRRRPQGFRFLNPELVAQHDVLSVDWTPWTSTFKSVEHSFPSGHTATAFAAFAVLSFFYPAGRRIFFTLAVLVGVQRIMVCAHFPSDVIIGALIGLLLGRACASFGRSSSPVLVYPRSEL